MCMMQEQSMSRARSPRPNKRDGSDAAPTFGSYCTYMERMAIIKKKIRSIIGQPKGAGVSRNISLWPRSISTTVQFIPQFGHRCLQCAK